MSRIKCKLVKLMVLLRYTIRPLTEKFLNFEIVIFLRVELSAVHDFDVGFV